ncbi:MAG: DUF5666 domain-containing protein [Pseudomonadota bacterium]
MSAVDRRGFLATALGLSLTGVLAGCAADDPVAARKPRKPREGGIGGTGIIGIVTAFGSIIVNGQRVQLDENTVVTDAFGPRPQDALALGQSLTLEAATVDGALVARRVHITHPVIGLVEAIASDGLALQVLGVTVRLEPGVVPPALIGQRVAVSGLWQGDVVVASRIDTLPDAGEDSVSGTLMPGGVVQAVRLGATGQVLPEDGVFVTAIGRFERARLVPATLTSGRFTGAAGPLQQLSVEGYLEPVSKAPGFALSGLGHSFDPGSQLASFADGRALFEGPYTGDFAVDLALPLPEGVDARRAALPAGLDLGTAPGARSTR